MTRPKNRWVACEAKRYGPVGNARHLSFGLDMILCGAMAGSARLWFGWYPNTTKPMCRECLRLDGQLPPKRKPRGV